MFYRSIALGSLLTIIVLTAGCRSAPVTGRKQMLLVPETQELSLGLSSFQEVTGKEPASQNGPYVSLVNRVGERIAHVAERPDYQWEFKVIASETQNAFCLPGGKVAVYEGIIPVCANEAGLAVVMSHEVAHALARHGGKRMSQNMVVDTGKQALAFVTRSQSDTKQAIFMQAYGLGAQYGVLLPYSRQHESEADHIGVMLMAKAGYDPREAPRFWTRFGSAKQQGQTMEFLSTHPADERRSRDLADLVPEALGFYEKAPQQFALGEPIPPPQPKAAAPAAGASLIQPAAMQTPAASPPPTSTPFAPPLFSQPLFPENPMR
jgi:predicted Zn-dependent protease